MTDLDSRIQQAKLRLDQAKARVQRLEARAKKADRARETRQKILAGTWILHMAEKNPKTKDSLLQGLSEFLKDPRDRALFELDQTPPSPQATAVPDKSDDSR